jgi:hypothetical protein
VQVPLRRRLAATAAAAAFAAAGLTITPAAARETEPVALPKRGKLVPGTSLGGVRLGMTPAQVRSLWGERFGVCRKCRQRTWYFTYRAFQPQGAAVSFRRGRVDAIWTLWSPEGWRTRDGSLRLGADDARVTAVLGPVVTIPCGSYSALLRTRRVTTLYYLFGGKLWGFGLMRPEASPCR